jgi:transposase
MSLQAQPAYRVPDETVRVARAAFPKGNLYLRIADTLGTIYTDDQFAALFAVQGQPAVSPMRLAVTTILQFAEGLSDRQAADAVRSRIDWKYLLCLELTDPGFDASVLSEFRTRLIAHHLEATLFETLLTRCRELGLVKVRGRQRTDSTHVLAAVRTLNRLERVGETLRAALNDVATVAPDWLRARAPADWYARYSTPIDNYKLPKTDHERAALASIIGADGRTLLAWCDDPAAPAGIRDVPAVEILRRVWQEQYTDPPDPIAWRPVAALAPAATLVTSPYDPEARWSTKRGMSWVGYKVHLTETCDPATPNLIVDVHTTPATTSDDNMLVPIHARLAHRQVLPATHLVDSGYVDVDTLIESEDQHGVAVVGPLARDPSWQAKANEGFDISAFQVDWTAKQVVCPQGQVSRKWIDGQMSTGEPIIHIHWTRATCLACPSRSQCTKGVIEPRHLSIRPQRQHETIHGYRKHQQTAAFKAVYAQRAGVEGTHAQGIARCDIRHARYRGLAKTHLQQLASATALNLIRTSVWLAGVPKATTYVSPFARLRRPHTHQRC